MKSGKQRRAELDAKKRDRAEKLKAERSTRTTVVRVLVVRSALAPHRSYSDPDFVQRGYYENKRFMCVDCGKAEVWTAAQQKWWYEVAKGNVFTTARRCRACRRRERERKAAVLSAQANATIQNAKTTLS